MPVRARRRLSGGIIGIVLSNQLVVGIFRVDHSIPRAYFQAITGSDEYEYLIDPVDLMARGGNVKQVWFGFEFRVEVSVVAGAVFGYERSNAQKFIDLVYEARSHALLLCEG